MTLELKFAIDLIIIALTCLVCLFFAVKNKRSLVLFLAIPVIVSVAIHSYSTSKAMQGLSRADFYPEEEVQILALALENKDWIHIWYLDAAYKQPRAIKIPYTEENKKRAQSLAKGLKEGKDVYAQLKVPNAGFMGPKSVEILEYEFSTEFHSKKEPGKRM